MLTNRQKLFIIISLIAGLVAVLLLWYFLVFKKSAVNQTAPASGETGQTAPVGNNGQVNQPTTTNQNPPAPVLSAAEQRELYAKQLARIFVERFSSYSNQNNNQHIDDVLGMVTPEMAVWIETQRLTDSVDYYGVTTQVVASSIEFITADSASVRVSVQQVIEDKQGKRAEQKSGTVKLSAEGTSWKVAGLFWE